MVSCLTIPVAGVRYSTNKQRRYPHCSSLVRRPLLANLDEDEHDEECNGDPSSYTAEGTPRKQFLNIDVVSERNMQQHEAETRSCSSSTRHVATEARSRGTYASSTGASTALWNATTIMNDTQRV